MGAVSQEFRCFIGGLSWSTNDQSLQSKFSEFGRIVEAKVICDKETRRSRGFGFVTFADEQSMEEAIERQHDKEFDGRVISVSRAWPKSDEQLRGDDFERYEHRDYDRYERDRDRDRDRLVPGTGSCFKCGEAGHWARECPLAQPPPPQRFSSSYSYRDRGRDRYVDRGDRYADRADRDYYYHGRADRYEDGGYGRERYRDREGRGGPIRYDRDRDHRYNRPAFDHYRPYHDRSCY